MITSNAPCSPPKLLYYSSTKKNLGANVVEQDGKSKKMAKKFQYSRLSKRMVKKNEG
jgi:hypothetical protein